MMSLLNSFGLGAIFQGRNYISPMAKQAELSIKRLKRSANKDLSDVQRLFDNLSHSLDDFRYQARIGMGMIIGGAAILSPLALMLKYASASEQRMKDVESLLLGTGTAADVANSQIKQLGSSILRMAGSTRVPLAELEKASYDLVSAGLSINETIGAMPATANLAVAGMGSMQEATQSMANTMNTFGKVWGDVLTPMEKGRRIANAYAGTIGAFKTTLTPLTLAMAYAAGPASILGTTLEETLAVIGQLQTSGIEASRSGTAVAAMFRELLNLQNKSAKDLGPLAGLELEDANGQLRPILSIVRDIESRVQGLGKVQIGRVLLKAFGEEGQRAIQFLIGKTDELQGRLNLIQANSPADMMAQSRSFTLPGLWQQFKNVLHAISITMGTTLLPFAIQLVSQFKNMAQGIQQFVQQHPLLTRLFIVFGIGLGLTLMLAGAVKILTGAYMVYKNLIPIIIKMTALSTGGFTGLAASIWATLWPILAVTAALAGLLYLFDLVAGTNIIGGIFDFAKSMFTIPTGLNVLPNQPAGLSLPGAGVLNGASEQGAGGAGVTTYNDYSTNKTYVTPSPGMNESELAEKTVQLSQRSKMLEKDGGM